MSLISTQKGTTITGLGSFARSQTSLITGLAFGARFREEIMGVIVDYLDKNMIKLKEDVFIEIMNRIKEETMNTLRLELKQEIVKEIKNCMEEYVGVISLKRGEGENCDSLRKNTDYDPKKEIENENSESEWVTCLEENF